MAYHGPSGDVNDPAVIAAVMTPERRYTPAAPIVGLYTDGGVIGQNPSLIGGTWAWCLVDASGEMRRHAVGWLTPAELDAEAVTNNHTELLALVLGLDGARRRFRRHGLQRQLGELTAGLSRGQAQQCARSGSSSACKYSRNPADWPISTTPCSTGTRPAPRSKQGSGSVAIP